MEPNAITRRDMLRSAGVLAASLAGWRLRADDKPAGTTGRSLDFNEIDRRLKATIDEKVFEGIGLLLCTSDKTLYKKAFGADTTETPHLLASATKLASTTAMMTIIDEKLAGLEDPIKKYLPQFGPVRGKITIRQLLSQTHGMAASHASIPAPQRDNGITLEESVNRIAKDDTVLFPSGSKHEYQPAVSYHIFGRIAEVVTSQDWATLFDKRVAGPLEMKTFTYGKTKNPRIGGGAKGSLQDYGNMLQMHLAGGVFKGRRVLSEASVAEMQRDQLRGIPFTPVAVRPNPKGYGLTWWFDVLDEKGNPEQFSCAGAYGAIPWLNRKAGYGGFLLVEKRLQASWTVYSELHPLINAMRLAG